MRRTFLILFLAACFWNTGMAQKTSTPTLTSIITKSISADCKNVTLENMNAFLKANSTKVVTITKNNICELFDEAKKFKECLITINSNALIRVTSYNMHMMSFDWNCKIPYGESIVKDKELSYKKNFINYFIGSPDMKKRTMYLIN